MKPISLLFGAALALSAQTPAFDVASIKPNQTGSQHSGIKRSRGQIVMENVQLSKAVLLAYGIPDDREYALSGPDWLGTERFDIQATFPGGTPAPQMQLMLQSLLAQRFNLALHKETRMLPAYDLVVAKNGPKVRQVAEGSQSTSAAPGKLEFVKTGMPKLADMLSRQLRQPVVNATRLTGVYDFTLEWSDEAGPSIFTAIQQQLGLKLEGRKAPAEVLVVDHMNRTPTPN